MLDYKKVSQLHVGDLVDLDGDKFADVTHSHPEYEFEYSEVQEIARETSDCIVVHFDGSSVGFPPNHKVRVHIDEESL